MDPWNVRSLCCLVLYYTMPHSPHPNIMTMPSESLPSFKIALLGAAGGIGQPLSLLIKSQLHLAVSAGATRIHLAMYDVAAETLVGVHADLAHIDTPVAVSAHFPGGDAAHSLGSCLQGADLVLCPAGMARRPGMTRADLFATNASIVRSLARDIAMHCDLATVHVLLISNPVNSLVPVVVRTLQQCELQPSGIEKRVLGVTALDATRASTFLGEECGNLHDFPRVPVIGGHSGATILPVFSQCPQADDLSQQTVAKLVQRVQNGGDEVVKAKNGKGSATLAMAHCGFRMLAQVSRMLIHRDGDIAASAYVALTHADGTPVAPGAQELMARNGGLHYFAVPITLSPQGVEEIRYRIVDYLNYNELNELLPVCIEHLRKDIELGVQFQLE